MWITLSNVERKEGKNPCFTVNSITLWIIRAGFLYPPASAISL